MIRQTSVSLRFLTIALIAAMLISGCNGSVSLGGELDLGGGDGEGGDGSSISQNQLLVVLMVILLVVALVGILRK